MDGGRECLWRKREQGPSKEQAGLWLQGQAGKTKAKQYIDQGPVVGRLVHRCGIGVLRGNESRDSKSISRVNPSVVDTCPSLTRSAVQKAIPYTASILIPISLLPPSRSSLSIVIIAGAVGRPTCPDTREELFGLRALCLLGG